MAAKLPSFEDLPLKHGDPIHSAWGLYGKDDQLGTLNRLTDDVVLQAAKEIQTGTRISLNWALDAQGDVPFFGRQVFEKNVYQKAPRCVNDDTWTFNTQGSSQWDGLRHFGYQKEKKFYNGTTLEDIHGKNNSNVLGIHVMAEKGIVGRGVLLDYHTWRERERITHEAFKTGSIKLEHLKAVAAAQGTELKFGDILFVRSGYMKAYNEMTREELQVLSKVQRPTFTGVENSDEMLKFIWNQPGFSAVAGDHPSWEEWPSQREPMMHEVLLAGWGLPIGELFDLEALAEHCQRVKRWSFFLTSEPVNVPGGVASPPQALAIF